MRTIELRRIARLRYGDALPSDLRADGDVRVMASGGRVGLHDRSNTLAPVIVIGRKGSHGSVYWSAEPCFVIDTAFAVDRYIRLTSARWLYYVLVAACLPKLSMDVGVPGLSRERVHELRIPDLVVAEQRDIADFLDRECERIAEATAAVQQTIAALDEPALALAAGEFETQPTGRIGYGFDVQLGKMLDEKRVDRDDTRPYLRNANVHWDRIWLGDLKEMTFDANDRRRFALRPGDLLVCEGGEPGRAAVWGGELDDCYFQKALHRVRPTGDASTRYLLWALRVLSRRKMFAVDGPGRYTHLTAEMLRAVRVPMPAPEVQRQRVAVIDSTANRAGAAHPALRRLLARLAEYRDALITEAVTGQLDITAASDAQLDERLHAAAEA